MALVSVEYPVDGQRDGGKQPLRIQSLIPRILRARARTSPSSDLAAS